MILAFALLLAGTGQGAVQDPPPVVHPQRLDEVGLAGMRPGSVAPRLVVAHRILPKGSFAEVTALDSGRTIVVAVEPDQMLLPGTIAALSPAAAAAIGMQDGRRAMIRIRPASPSPMEQAAIRAGTVVMRLDAPPSLLAALRRRLPQPAPVAVQAAASPVVVPRPAAARPTPRPVAPPQAAPKPRPAQSTGRWFVQVAALSDAGRAGILAKSVDGVVRSAGRLYRVQAGPFATRAAAESARAAMARRGFGDARIIAQD